MKAIRVAQFGGPEVLEFCDVTEPEVADGQVRVRLRVVGVNPNETYIRTGTYSFALPDLPYTPGFDGAGVVDAVGDGVDGFAEGDRVFVAGLLAQHNTGTYAEKVVCSSDAVYRLPDNVSFEAGAALGIPAVTAFRILFQTADVKPGETVLIHGASGGVGTLAVQMAAAHGARVIGTASTAAGRALVEHHGAALAIDHLTAGDTGELTEFTGGAGPDIIVEFLANENLNVDMAVVAQFGRIVIAGSRGTIDVNPRQLMVKEARLLGTALWNVPAEEYRQALLGVEAFLQAGTLRPVVGTRLPLAHAARAHELILGTAARGKMVLEV